MTDTGAYIGGMLYRKTNKPIHYLAPRISPKKTVEGAICGTVCGTLIGSLFFIFVVSPYELTLPWYVDYFNFFTNYHSTNWGFNF